MGPCSSDADCAANESLTGCFPYHVPACPVDPYGCQCSPSAHAAYCASGLCGNITDPCNNTFACGTACTACAGDAICQNITFDLTCLPYAYVYSYVANLGCLVPDGGPLGRPDTLPNLPVSIWTNATAILTNATAQTHVFSPVPQVFECTSVCHSNADCIADPALIGC